MRDEVLKEKDSYALKVSSIIAIVVAASIVRHDKIVIPRPRTNCTKLEDAL